MSDDVQRVVIIQGTSNIVNYSAVEGILEGFSLKPGDEITLVQVLHPASKSNKFSELFGYKSKGDSSGVFEMSHKFFEEERIKIEDEYHNSTEVLYISSLCETRKVDFHVEILTGTSPKQAAVKAARNFNATWVVLDRKMKKYKKYFMDKLSCGMSRMKSNNTITKLRGPKTIGEAIMSAERSSTSQVTYDEMIPGSTEEENAPGKQGGNNSEPIFRGKQNKKCLVNEKHTKNIAQTDLQNTEASSSTESKRSSLLDEITTNTEKETAGEQSPFSNYGRQQQNNRQEFEITSLRKDKKLKDNIKGGIGNQSGNVFRISSCPICKTKTPKIGWKRDFTFTEIHNATEGFSPKNFISEGGFGSVFRGEFNGLKIAVKQHKQASFQGELEFKSEVDVLSKVRHENLVTLLGSCSEGNQRLLIYEYVCNGSLDYHLSKHTHRTLSWEKRIKIAMGAAKGLQYLHQNNIIHRDVKPNNILITCDHESLLGDFGLARTQHSDQSLSETRVVGSLGYMAPEYAVYGKSSTKTDVYAFGLVLLQLITGLRTTDKIQGGKSLMGWARPLIKERNYPDLIDQRIVDSHDVHQLFWMVEVVEKCLRKDPHKRITMDKVVEYLDYMMEVDTLFSSRDSSLAETESNSVSSKAESMESSYEHTTPFYHGKQHK